MPGCNHHECSSRRLGAKSWNRLGSCMYIAFFNVFTLLWVFSLWTHHDLFPLVHELMAHAEISTTELQGTTRKSSSTLATKAKSPSFHIKPTFQTATHPQTSFQVTSSEAGHLPTDSISFNLNGQSLP